MPPCLIGMEACASYQYWASTQMSLGYTGKLMAPQFVKPYVKTNKHDAADAEAICDRDSTQYAVRPCQIPGATDRAGTASDPSIFHQATDRSGQSDPGITRGIWYHHPPRHNPNTAQVTLHPWGCR